MGRGCFASPPDPLKKTLLPERYCSGKSAKGWSFYEVMLKYKIRADLHSNLVMEHWNITTGSCSHNLEN